MGRSRGEGGNVHAHGYACTTVQPKAWLVLACFLMAGCADDPPASAPEDETPPEVTSTLGPPTWEVGDSWSWKAPWGDYTLVVTGQTATDYIIGSNDPGTAWFNEMEPVSMMGPQRKSDLAGSQGSARVQFFDWPLEDGRQWATQWDGNDYRVVASEQPDGSFRMQAHQAEVVRIEYTYDPSLKWFSELTFYDENGTDPQSVKISDFQAGWTGEIATWTYEVIDEGTLSGATTGPPKTYTIPPATDLYLSVTMSCNEAGPVFFALGPAESLPTIATGSGGDGYTINRECPSEVADELVVSETPSEGNWGMLHAFGSSDAELSYSFMARTLEMVPVAGS